MKLLMFKCWNSRWGNIKFPMPLGRVMSLKESFVHGLDEETSASLKFIVLNPKGRIWTMVAGGASVIYTDTCATADPGGKKRALVIGGRIANFTDVAATFNGLIRALKEKETKLKAAQIHIYVRRGGPNYQKGLAKMRMLGEEIGIPIKKV
ncbi:ATP-citrate synthase alpha chain protein 2 [Bienertia sinuspersici]